MQIITSINAMMATNNEPTIKDSLTDDCKGMKEISVIKKFIYKRITLKLCSFVHTILKAYF